MQVFNFNYCHFEPTPLVIKIVYIYQHGVFFLRGLVFFRFYMKKTDSWVFILQCDPVLFRWGFFYDEKWRPVINLLGNWHYSSFHWLLELLGFFCESRFRHPTLNLGLKEEMTTFMVSQELLNIPTFRRLSPYTVIIVNYV